MRTPPGLRRLARFGAVGLAGYVVDAGLFNVLRYAGDPGVLENKPLTAKVLSVTVATVVTYLGHRHWTWADRDRRGLGREYVLFFVLNGAGMAIAVACLGVSHYVFDLTGPLADNISANVVGLALGTAFRFWAYPRFVFRLDRSGSALERPPAADRDGLDDPEAAQRPGR